MNTKSRHNLKLHFKAKISKEWDPYFVGERHIVNTASKEDIVAVVNRFIPNKIVATAMIDELHSFFLMAWYQIRLAGDPEFFRSCAWEEKYSDFVRSCAKMSLSTADVQGKDWLIKQKPLPMFSLYQYFNAIIKKEE